MNMRRFIPALFVLAFLLIAGTGFAQTTGKIAGTVTDKETGEALPGANVILLGTSLGAAAGPDGSFYIINVPPGSYDVKFQFLGYESLTIEGARVNVNRTFEVEAKLNSTVIAGSEVVVTADKITVKKDQTNTIRNVSSDEIEILPVQSVGEVIQLQAGVVGSNFRGGRTGEVTYLIDGIQVDNAFGGSGQTVSVETDAVAELEVLVGTFNAEYGNAMSGVVNMVTKEGSEKWKGRVSSAFSNYATGNSDKFFGLNKDDWLTRNLSQDYRVSLEGPIFGNKLTFFMNYRFQNNNGHLNGQRLFNPSDYSDYTSSNPLEWHTESTGDSAYVSMIQNQSHNFTGKVTWRVSPELKISGMLTANDWQGKGYSHILKYNPDPRETSYTDTYMTSLTMNHMLSRSLFYDLKFSYVDRQSTSYLYEDPLDSRYLHPKYSGTGHSGFDTGGTPWGGQSWSTFKDATAKWDMYWQANNTHSLKFGVQFIQHEVDQDKFNVRNKWAGTGMENESIVDPETGTIEFPFFELEENPITDKTIGVYNVKPYEASAYVQDKMEFNEMVINLGVRYDYFNSDFVYPTNRRNPDNEQYFEDQAFMSEYPKAPAKTQFSPRVGMAYQLSDQAVVRFAYGHFFQTPPMYAMFANNKFRVPLEPFGTTMGNTTLEPEKTVNYEIGVWQELAPGMGLDLALYYKDIYNLLSTAIYYTYDQIPYGLYVNKDYGNARGMEVTWDWATGDLTTSVNYTLAFTRGNADNPAS
ncbi:MAG: TonB-dependent receptor, partial [Calditrichaeota bacterium]